MPRRKTQRGASFVEAAVVFPTFMLLIFGIIELGKYFLVALSVNHAAYRAADFVSRAHIETELDDTSCNKDEESLAECAVYVERILPALENTFRQALPAFIRTGTGQSGGYAELQSFQHYRQSDYTPTLYSASGFKNRILPFAFIRPGEVAYNTKTSSDYYYEDCPPEKSSATSSCKGWPTGGLTWEERLRAQPVAIHVKVVVDSFLPFLNGITYETTQYAYRRSTKGSVTDPGPMVREPPNWVFIEGGYKASEDGKYSGEGNIGGASE